MYFYCCNYAVPWLNEGRSRIFRYTVIFKKIQINLYFACLPFAVRPGSAMCTGPVFLTKNVISVYNMNVLFRKRFIHCAIMIPFILHWPSFFFSCTKLRKLYEGSGKESCWYCSTKPQNLRERLGEELLK